MNDLFDKYRMIYDKQLYGAAFCDYWPARLGIGESIDLTQQPLEFDRLRIVIVSAGL